MLRGVFRTKEGKIIAAFLVLIITIIGVFLITSYSENRRFVEQAVMAENYMKAGSYEQAAAAYLKALSMKNSDQQKLTIGLADAYVGMNDYDKALEVLRACYQKTSGKELKEKIEEVTSIKTDYEYLQSISRAEIYFTNEEYDKAIAEFEKAKLIKSKEVTSYKRIAESYIKKGEYTLAKEEVQEGQAITGDKSLNITLAIVDTYLNKEQYAILVAEAAEYIYQENYEDGIKKYQEAISRQPKEVTAYQGLAEAYLVLEDYTNAVIILKEGLELVGNDVLKDLYEQATELKEVEEERINFLIELKDALEDYDLTSVTELMNLPYFKKNIAEDAPVFFEDGSSEFSDEKVMIIINKKQVYYGGYKNGSKTGEGIYFKLTTGGEQPEYYCYNGEWVNGIPNGKGKTEEVIVSEKADNIMQLNSTVTIGSYVNALEEGKMTKYFYKDKEQTGWVEYKAMKGAPLPLTNDNEEPIPTPEAERYIIGIIYLGNQSTGEYYSVQPQTIWGVESFN